MSFCFLNSLIKVEITQFGFKVVEFPSAGPLALVRSLSLKTYYLLPIILKYNVLETNKKARAVSSAGFG